MYLFSRAAFPYQIESHLCAGYLLLRLLLWYILGDKFDFGLTFSDDFAAVARYGHHMPMTIPSRMRYHTDCVRAFSVNQSSV